MCNWDEIHIKHVPKIIGATILMLILLFWVVMWGVPRYDLWLVDMNGQERLKKAEWDRKVAEIETETAEAEGDGYSNVQTNN